MIGPLTDWHYQGFYVTATMWSSNKLETYRIRAEPEMAGSASITDRFFTSELTLGYSWCHHRDNEEDGAEGGQDDSGVEQAPDVSQCRQLEADEYLKYLERLLGSAI